MWSLTDMRNTIDLHPSQSYFIAHKGEIIFVKDFQLREEDNKIYLKKRLQFKNINKY